MMNSRLDAMKKYYGDDEGKRIYDQMREEGKHVPAQKKEKKKKFKPFSKRRK